MRRRLYGTIAICIMVGSFVIGAWIYALEVGIANYAVTLSPSQTQVYITTQTALYSIILFVCGALFSAGLSMAVNLIELEKK